MTLIHSPEMEWPSGEAAESVGPESMAADTDKFAAILAKSPDPRSRIAWLEGAFRSANDEHIRLAVATLSDADAEVRAAAASALRPCPTDAVEMALIDWVLESPRMVRAKADDALPALRDSLGSRLHENIKDESVSVDRMAASAYLLGRMGFVEAADDLRNRAWTRNRDIAFASAEALARIATAKDLPALEELSTHPEPGIRQIVVSGAANVGGEEGINLLHAIAMQPREPEYDVLYAAVNALGASNHPRGVHALIDILQKRSDLRPETLIALQRLTKLPLDRVPSPWFGWYEVWAPNSIWPIPVPKQSPFDPSFVQGNFSPGQ